jgi:hypothetical protein
MLFERGKKNVSKQTNMILNNFLLFFFHLSSLFLLVTCVAAIFQRTFDDGERAQKAAVAAIEHESPFMHPFARKAQVCVCRETERESEMNFCHHVSTSE